MTTHATSLGVGLERAMRHWRERGALREAPADKKVGPGITIAISRECGAGGSTIARALADKLGWPLYDRELVEKIAADAGIHDQLLADLDEKQPNWLAECWEGFAREKHVSGPALAIRMKKVLLALYCHGECVVLGRGAAQVLPGDHALFVRLIAPKSDRISRISERFALTEKQATARMQEIDRGRDQFVRSYFHKDPAETSHYDLVLKTSRFTETACTDIILSALKGRHGIE